MRLIDADKLIKYVKQEPTDGMYVEEIIETIEEQPTAYDIDKISEQLELNSKLYSLSDRDCEIAIPLNIAIKIVKGGAV